MAIDLVLDTADETPAATASSEANETALLAKVEDLTPEEQAKVEAFANKIDLHKTEITTNYGSTVRKQSAAVSSKTLANVKTKDTGVVSDLLVEMVAVMNGTNKSDEKASGILEKFLKKVKGEVTVFRTKNESVEHTLERIEKQLEGHKLILQKDINMLDDLYDENWEIYKGLTLYIKAGEIAIEKAKADLTEMYSAARSSGRPEDAVKADDFSAQIDEFDKQIDALRRTRAVCLQSAPRIKSVQRMDTALTRKLQTSIMDMLPLWRNQLAQSIAQEHTIKAAEAANAVDEMTNKMLREGAKQFHTAVVESAKASQRSSIDTETIDFVYNEVIAAVSDVISIEEEGRRQRAAAVQVLADSEKKLVSGILNAAKPKADNVVDTTGVDVTEEEPLS